MAVFTPDAPLLAYQFIPAITAICLVGLVLFLLARRGAPKRVLERKIEPLAANQIWSAIPVVLVVAVALFFVPLPAAVFTPPLRIAAMPFAASLTPAAGWHVSGARDYPWVSRIYGHGANLLRQTMVADVGDPSFDKFGRPRTVVVDSLTSARPFSLDVFPGRRALSTSTGSASAVGAPADLGYGVKARLVSAVDDKLLVTWDAVQWTWTNALSHNG